MLGNGLFPLQDYKDPTNVDSQDWQEKFQNSNVACTT